mgnify:CR=1 FL=1
MGQEMLANEKELLSGGSILGKPHSQGALDLDPRTFMAVLVAVSVLAFIEKGLVVELVLVCAVAILQALCGHIRMAFGFMAGYAVLVAILHLALPAIGGIAATMFTISLTFARKIYLCLMVGTLLISEASVHRIATALAKLKIPQSVLIPLTVTLRYKEEASHIRDAMALRDIPVGSRVECFVVPLVMSATSTADELARAATCRGIENPSPSTDTERLSMRWFDWAVIAISAAVVILVALLGGEF